MNASAADLFALSEAWQATYPGSAAGILALRGVANPPQHPLLEERKATLEERLRTQFAGCTRAELRTLPVLQAYDAYYRRFQQTYHVALQLESVALKGKSLPRVAALVEAMFMAELDGLLLTAGHDLTALDLPVWLDIAAGTERYVLMSGQEQSLKAGDMYMADRQGAISSILLGPDRRTRITAQTEAALFAVYAPPGIGRTAVERHLEGIAANVRLITPQVHVVAQEVYGPA
jgi:DNA/RNA-binding domain of Phe-tRNA-synthetase-like protein